MALARGRLSVPSNERELAHTASRASKRRMSLRAAAHSGCAFASMQSRSLAPCRDTRLLPINIPGRPLAHACASPTRRAHLRCRSCTCTLKATLAAVRHDLKLLYMIFNYSPTNV
jgi:hypothetical protein